MSISTDQALDDFFEVGVTVELGTHRFDAEAIKAFARQWDPQRFHVDEELAKGSVFGALCASGWHPASVWMMLNVATPPGRPWTGNGPAPVFGPSPGFRDLKWLKPVYAGDTVSYARQVTGHRALASRPGWRVLTVLGSARDSAGDPVLSFESGVLAGTG